MKNRTNQILLTVTIITAVLYVFLLLNWLEIVPLPFHDPDDPFRFYALRAWLGLGFHVIPVFCVQLLLCRIGEYPLTRLIPTFLTVGAAVIFGLGLLTSTGWDALGWGILLCLTAAPAVGCVLAWVVYGIQRMNR